MPNYTYLIIGGGMTAASAIQGIREVDRDGSIGVLSSEKHPPYDRPPLSKGLWKGESLEDIWREAEGQGVSLHLGRTARRLEPSKKLVVDDLGNPFGYRKLLLATGGRPRRLPFGGDRVLYFRSLDDYKLLRDESARGERFAVIGGGFIGSEIAAALAINGKEVVMIFPDLGIGGRMFPPELSRFLNDYYRGKGVEVLSESRVLGMETRGDQAVLSVRKAQGEGSQEVVVDGVVAGIGIEPNVELAQAAGLEVENGIHVDASLCTSQPDIYAAGDVANFFNPALGGRVRVEHEDNANSMGEIAGHAMAGQAVNYDHLPYFYSDLFDLGYEAVGEVDARLDLVTDWKEPFQEGVVYYLRNRRVRGVLLWNVWEQVDAARGLIAEPGPFKPEDLTARLPA